MNIPPIKPVARMPSPQLSTDEEENQEPHPLIPRDDEFDPFEGIPHWTDMYTRIIQVPVEEIPPNMRPNPETYREFLEYSNQRSERDIDILSKIWTHDDGTIGTDETLMMYCQIAPRVYIAHTTPVVEAVIATRRYQTGYVEESMRQWYEDPDTMDAIQMRGRAPDAVTSYWQTPIIILHPLELYDFLVQTGRMQPIPEDALMDGQLAIHYVKALMAELVHIFRHNLLNVTANKQTQKFIPRCLKMNHGHLVQLQEIPTYKCNIQFDRDYINTSQETNEDVTVDTGNVAATWH